MNAIMNDFNRIDAKEPQPQQWQGFAELDQAIRENRLMEYRLRKSWADPWGRNLTIAGSVVILSVFAFLAGAASGLW